MRHTGLKLAALVAAMALGGCSLIPAYQRPEAPVPQQWDSPAPTVAGGTLASWPVFFKDARLKDLIGQALENNRDLRVAALNVEKAQALYRIQRADLLPTIGATVAGDSQRTPADLSTTGRTQVTHVNSAGIGFTAYELDFFGRVRSLNEEALETYLQDVEAQRSARIALVAEVASAWYQLQADQQLLAIARQTLASQQASYGLVKSSYDNQVSTELDLSQAESTVRTAQSSQAQYTRQVEQDKNALVLLVGKPLAPEVFQAVQGLPAGMEDNLPVGLPSDLLTLRPDIQGAEHALKAANADIGAARAAFFPSISLTASAGSASSDLGHLFAGGQGAWSFAPSINLPIFNAGRNRANLDAAKVQKSIEVANYQKAIQVAFREVADGLVAQGTLNDQVNADSLLVTANMRSYQLADRRYQEGVDTYLNSLDAQRNLFASQQTLVQSQLARLNNSVSLYEALGGGQ